MDRPDVSPLTPALVDRLPPSLRRIVDRANSYWLGRLVLGTMASSRRVELFDRSMTIAAQVFTSVLPLLIALASLFGWSSEKIAGVLVVPDEARTVVEETLSTTSSTTFGFVGVLVVIVSATSLSRALTRACAAQWDLERPSSKLAAAWRWVAAVMALLVTLVAAKQVYRMSISLPPPGLWELALGLLPDVAIALFIPWLLLAGAVRIRLLVPGALIFGVVMLLVRSVSSTYLPDALQASASRYGSLGVAFTYIAWLYVVAWCFLLSGIVGKVVARDPGWLGRWIRGETRSSQRPPNVS